MLDVSCLPDEVLLRVFQYLSISDLKYSVLSVCRLWHEVAEDPTLWKDVCGCVNIGVKTSTEKFGTQDVLINSLTKRDIRRLQFLNPGFADVYDFLRLLPESFRKRIFRIVFKEYAGLRANDIQHIFYLMPNLSELVFLGDKGLSFQELLDLNGIIFPTLTVISLPAVKPGIEYCRANATGNPRAIYSRCMGNFLSCFSNLKSVSFSGDQHISGEFLKGLFITCRKVEHLNLSCSQITDDDLFAVCTEGTESNRLVTLNLSKCKNLTDKSVVIILDRNSRSLEELHLNFVEIGLPSCKAITKLTRISSLYLESKTLVSQTLVSLSPILGHIKKLSLSSYLQLTTPSLFNVLSMGDNFTCVTYLNIAGCPAVDDRCLKVICQKAVKIESLDLSSCTNITDVGLKNVFKYLSGIRCFVMKWCINVSDVGLSGEIDNRSDVIEVRPYPIVSDLKRLEALDVSFCPMLTNVSCSVLKDITTLVSLHLNGLKNITDDGLNLLLNNLKSLELLSVKSCKELTDFSLQQTVRLLPRINSLDISKCPNVNDATLRYIITHGRHLRELLVSDFGQISKSVAFEVQATITNTLFC